MARPASPDERSAWFAERTPDSPGHTLLFLLPYAGGGAVPYAGWDRYLDGIDVMPALLPGRERRFSEPPLRRLDDLLDGLVPAIQLATGDRPFALFGHSMGAVVAYEAARRLEQRGLVPRRVFVSGRDAPTAAGSADLHLMPDAELIQFLRGLGGTPDAVLADDELVSLYLPTIRADLEVAAHYRHHAASPLSCPLEVFLGDGDAATTDGLGWEGLSARGVTVEQFPGGHFFAFQESRARVLAHLHHQLRT